MNREHAQNERGSASTELALITPVLLTLLLLVVSLGRIATARIDVDAAARDAARAAANARSGSQAISFGDEAGRAALEEGSVHCRSLSIEVDTSAFRAGGTVRATVSCTVELATLTGVALPGSRTVTASFLAPVDRYRRLE
jgi:Flp pilus assembly protein TadG